MIVHDAVFVGGAIENVRRWADPPGATRQPGAADIWARCERRLRGWRVPPRWSARDWWDEMRAEGAAAELLALRDYRPETKVPVEVYVQMRIMGRILTRYRQEWSYALRLSSADLCHEPAAEEADLARASQEEIARALARLPADDRRLLMRLFWNSETEAQVARSLGVSQQAVSKRKLLAIRNLQRILGHEGHGAGVPSGTIEHVVHAGRAAKRSCQATAR